MPKTAMRSAHGGVALICATYESSAKNRPFRVPHGLLVDFCGVARGELWKGGFSGADLAKQLNQIMPPAKAPKQRISPAIASGRPVIRPPPFFTASNPLIPPTNPATANGKPMK